jgi:hypothetical protein
LEDTHYYCERFTRQKSDEKAHGKKKKKKKSGEFSGGEHYLSLKKDQIVVWKYVFAWVQAPFSSWSFGEHTARANSQPVP